MSKLNSQINFGGKSKRRFRAKKTRNRYLSGKVRTYKLTGSIQTKAQRIVNIARSSGENVDYNSILNKIKKYQYDSQHQLSDWVTDDCNGCGNGKKGGCLWDGPIASGCMNGIIDISVSFK